MPLILTVARSTWASAGATQRSAANKNHAHCFVMYCPHSVGERLYGAPVPKKNGRAVQALPYNKNLKPTRNVESGLG